MPSLSFLPGHRAWPWCPPPAPFTHHRSPSHPSSLQLTPRKQMPMSSSTSLFSALLLLLVVQQTQAFLLASVSRTPLVPSSSARGKETTPRHGQRGGREGERQHMFTHPHVPPPPPPTHTPHLIDSTRAHWSGGQHARGAPEALGGRGRYAQTHAPIDAPNSTHASNPGTHQWLANHLHPVKPTPKGATWPTQAGTTCKKKQPTNPPPPPPPQKKKRAR